jgi:hypothetical protein
MNTAPPLEYVTSFAEASQTKMQRLTTTVITSGESDADFSRFAEVASIVPAPGRYVKSGSNETRFGVAAAS